MASGDLYWNSSLLNADPQCTDSFGVRMKRQIFYYFDNINFININLAIPIPFSFIKVFICLREYTFTYLPLGTIHK